MVNDYLSFVLYDLTILTIMSAFILIPGVYTICHMIHFYASSIICPGLKTAKSNNGHIGSSLASWARRNVFRDDTFLGVEENNQKIVSAPRFSDSITRHFLHSPAQNALHEIDIITCFLWYLWVLGTLLMYFFQLSACDIAPLRLATRVQFFPLLSSSIWKALRAAWLVSKCETRCAIWGVDARCMNTYLPQHRVHILM